MSSSRAIEVLLVALLVVATGGVVFEMQNQSLLRDLLTEIRGQSHTLATISQQRTAAAAVAESGPSGVPDAKALIESLTAEIHKNRAELAVRPVEAPKSAPVPAALPEQIAASPAPITIAAAPAAPAPAPSPAPLESQKKPEPAKPAPASVSAGPAVPLPATIDPASQAVWDDFGGPITQIITQLLEGQYDHVIKQFDPTLAANLPREKIAQIIDPIRNDHGILKRVVEHEGMSGLEAKLAGFSVLVEQTDGHRIQFWITLDRQKRIAGLLMK